MHSFKSWNARDGPPQQRSKVLNVQLDSMRNQLESSNTAIPCIIAVCCKSYNDVGSESTTNTDNDKRCVYDVGSEGSNLTHLNSATRLYALYPFANLSYSLLGVSRTEG